MIAAGLFYLILCAGGVFAAAWGKRAAFEDGATLSGFLLTLLLFGFGLCGALRAGVAAVLIAAGGLYALSLYAVLKSRDCRGFFARLCTPAFAFFTLAFLLTVFSNAGRLVANRDDLAHWADTVKIMFQTDAFADTPISHAQYQTYLPGMALLQYLLERLNGTFAEWLLFLPPVSMLYLLALPLLSGLTWRAPARLTALSLAAAALPGVLFPTVWRTLMIDPYLACLSGFCLALSARGGRDRLSCVTLVFALPALTLVKQSGIGLALMIGAVALLCGLLSQRRGKALLAPLSGCALSGLVTLMWRLRTNADGAVTTFPGRVDWAELFGILAGKTDGGYRLSTLTAFFRRAALTPLDTGALYLPLSFLFWLLLLGLLAALLWQTGKKRGLSAPGQGAALLGGFAVALLFSAGTALSYLYKFTEYEASVLNCFDRYMSTPLTMLAFLLLALAAERLKAGGPNRALLAALLGLTLLCAPYKEMASFALRKNAAYSQMVRAPYTELIARVEQTDLPEDARVALVSEGSRDFDLQMLRFALRPLWLPEYETLALGDGDLGGACVDAARWQQALTEEGFTHVILMRIGDGFSARCAEAFTEPGEIAPGGVYRLEPDGRLTAISLP